MDDNQGIPKMTFKEGNKIRYGQDFGYYIGVPAGIEFSVEQSDDRFILTAPGYGVIGNDNEYGNGKLHVYGTDLQGLLDQAEDGIDEDEWKQAYERLVYLLEKRFPQCPDGSMPDLKVEDVLVENGELREELRVKDGLLVEAYEVLDSHSPGHPGTKSLRDRIFGEMIIEDPDAPVPEHDPLVLERVYAPKIGDVWRKSGPADWLRIESRQLPGFPEYDGALRGISIRLRSYKGKWDRTGMFMPCFSIEDFTQQMLDSCRFLERKN